MSNSRNFISLMPFTSTPMLCAWLHVYYGILATVRGKNVWSIGKPPAHSVPYGPQHIVGRTANVKS